MWYRCKKQGKMLPFWIITTLRSPRLDDLMIPVLNPLCLAISSFHAALTPHQIANDAIFDPRAKSNGPKKGAYVLEYILSGYIPNTDFQYVKVHIF